VYYSGTVIVLIGRLPLKRWIAFQKPNRLKIRILLWRLSMGEEKADPDKAQALLDRTQKRLENADYSVVQTPYGYFLDLSIEAPGHPLARVYKEF